MKTTITVSKINSSKKSMTNKVMAIRALRGFTGMTIQDAKSVLENIYVKGCDMTLPVRDDLYVNYIDAIPDYYDWAKRGEIKIELNPANTPPRRELAHILSDALTYATLCNENDIAATLNKILKLQLPDINKEEKC